MSGKAIPLRSFMVATDAIHAGFRHYRIGLPKSANGHYPRTTRCIGSNPGEIGRRERGIRWAQSGRQVWTGQRHQDDGNCWLMVESYNSEPSLRPEGSGHQNRRTETATGVHARVTRTRSMSLQF
jgi:hypothetical protein